MQNKFEKQLKKNRKYWKKRFEILEESAIKKGADYYESLDKQYRIAEKRIESQISTWYQRFAYNNNISLTEARRLLNSSELEEFKWSVEEYIKHGQQNAFTQEWMKELENASAKVHISRLESLKLQMQQELEVLYGNQLDGVDKLARDIYSDNYYHTAFEIQKGFNVGWNLHSLDNRLLDKVISKPWTADGRTFSDKLWTQKNDLITTLHTEITQAIMRGDAPDRAIDTIARKFKVAKSKAGRLVMTESAYFASASQKDCFDELDVERFEIVATLDSHTSELCQSMDGVVQDMKNFEPGVTAPPFHPWCRTTTVPYFDDDFGERAARDADGNVYYVPSDMTYAEWKNGFVNGETSGLQEIKPKEDEAGKIEIKTEPEVASYSFTNEEAKAIEHYVSGEGQYINQYYRGNIGSYFGELSEDEKTFAKRLDEATDRVLPDDIDKLYRSVDARAVFSDMTDNEWYSFEEYVKYGGDGFGKGAYADRIRQNAKSILNETQGKIITEKGFMSTSKDYDVVAEWGDFTGADRPIMIEFDVPKGVKGADLKDFDIEGDEQFEVLLARDTKYRVVDVTAKDGNIYVKAEIIPDDIGKPKKKKAVDNINN